MQRRLTAVLGDVAAELTELACSAEALQAQFEHTPVRRMALGAGASGYGPGASDQGVKRHIEPADGGEDLVVALQSLDYMTQALHCLAGFLSGAAKQVAPECDADFGSALRSVWLSKLRVRLGNDVLEPAASGEVELFDAA
jgi:hypothetical protein